MMEDLQTRFTGYVCGLRNLWCILSFLGSHQKYLSLELVFSFEQIPKDQTAINEMNVISTKPSRTYM